MKWMNVNKLLPKEGNYLCFLQNGFIKMCFYNEKEWHDMWETTLKGEVRFWMPLPPSPYEERIINCNRIPTDDPEWITNPATF